MRREGRQHGMVRTYRIAPSPWNPRPDARTVNKFDSPPTCGLFTKVPQRPTNHSKFTGKCGRARCVDCHMHPAFKSKDKTKGNHKLINSRGLVSNYKMITWRVVDGRPGLNFSGLSATEMLDHLASDYVDDNVDDDDDEANDVYDHNGRYDQRDHEHEIKEAVRRNDDDDDNANDEDQDVMGYYDVAFDQVNEEDEGWCLLGEI